MNPTYSLFINNPLIWRDNSKTTPITINRLVPPKPIELGKFQKFVANCGKSATKPKKTEPTVDNFINIFEI